MVDIFCPEFLACLRQQLGPKSKPSKALLQAIKSLTSANQVLKRQLQQCNKELLSARQENAMLMEIVEANKADYQAKLQSKQQWIQRGIQIEAKLSAEVEGLRRQLEALQGELDIARQAPLTSRGSLDIVSQPHSQEQLNQYLYGPGSQARALQQKQREQSIEGLHENEISVEEMMGQGRLEESCGEYGNRANQCEQGEGSRSEGEGDWGEQALLECGEY